MSDARLHLLRRMASRLAGARTAKDVCAAAAEVLAGAREDLPFALLYVIEAGEGAATLAGAAGLDAGGPASPGSIPLESPEGGPRLAWPIAEALRNGPLAAGDLTARFGSLPGFEVAEPSQALLVPVVAPGDARPCGVLVAALDPGKPLDDAYRGYLELVALQVGAGIAAARAPRTDAHVARTEEDLRHAIAARDAFISAASHELRTPLTTLGLQLDGLVRSMQGSSEPVVQRWHQKAEKLRAQAHRLEHLIESMLDVFGFASERPQLRREDVDLADVAREAVERARRESKHAQATVELQARPALGRWDRERLERIVVHLLGNALKFGRGRTVDVVVEPSGELARLTVVDRGIGIAPEDHDRIFGRFERAASGNHYGGFGLGLWIVRELVQAMSGTVRVESRPESGSTFVVELPRYAP
jgi:signal transduction histidine kinase